MENNIKEMVVSLMKKIFLQIKVFLFGLATLFVLGILVFIFLSIYSAYHIPADKVVIPIQALPDYKNMTYTVGGESFTLKDGRAEKEYVPGSASKKVLSIFGEPIFGDLNGDGNKNDAALWLEDNLGGSGTFYYAVLLINDNGTYKVTNAMLLGDRIAPQTLEIQDGRAVYNYAIRRGNEPFSTPPSIGVSTWVNYDVASNEIGEWAKDFEGEVVNNNIHVTSPIFNDYISSPLVIKGEARGVWYFEASFPVVLTNWDGLIIAQGIATAEEDWMTENFVPFTATLTFEKPSYGENGFLILKKDNPSGLSQYDDSIEIPINFK